MIYEIRDENRILTLIPSTPRFREMAAALSVRKAHPLISDCTEVWMEDGRVLVRKPSLDGKSFSKYALDNCTSYILLLKVSDAAERLLETVEQLLSEHRGEAQASKPSISIREIQDSDASCALLAPLAEPRDEEEVLGIEESQTNGTHVRDAKLIFSGGRGIMNQESFDALRKLAKKFGASVGASRPMVDQGWATWDEQIGQTGSIVRPTVYVAFGISGAVQHITGIEKSQNIIAVNLNGDAPIFRYANYGVACDDNSIIRNMLNLLENK